MPTTIGPYHLGGPLGRGGMGEVYRGYDERLARPVALKRVRLGVQDLQVASRRLQREARAVAQLNHAAIVQVYDWVDTDEGSWLVMELVEGRSLREILHQGPLATPRVLSFARDLLEGLAVAHEAGVVHRDFKTENIMITADSSAGRNRGEQAKILDFGLAKNTRPELDESQLSVEGKILGTLSAMAPEQVLGESVDGRTDLFALGCVLYETLTGKAPFVGRNAAETLNRICTEVQLPVLDFRDDLPLSLSQLVDHLLEKDPRRRPASALEALELLEGDSADSLASLNSLTRKEFETAAVDFPSKDSDEGAEEPHREPAPPVSTASNEPRRHRFLVPILLGFGLLAALTLGGFWALRPQAPSGPIYVAVPATETSAGTSSEGELAAQAIHATLLQGLVDLEDVVALEVPDKESGSTDPRTLARTLAADEVLWSRLHCNALGCRAELRRVSGEDGSVLWTRSFSADPTRPLDLGQAVLGYLALAFPEHLNRLEQGSTTFEVRPEDYESFLRLRQRLLRPGQDLPRESLLTELAELGKNSPRFAAIPVLEAHLGLMLFQGSRSSEDLEQATKALARARTLAPEDPQVLLLAARAARYARDLDTAEDLLDSLNRLEPGNMEARYQLALVHEARGEFDRATTLALEAVQRLPSLYLLLSVSDLLNRRGDFAGARELIEEALERNPDSFDGLTRLAHLELSHGDMKRAAELYTTLVERSPESPELINLGTAQMMLGRYEEAIRCFTREAERNPESPYALLSLADVEKLGGDPERARALYAEVIQHVEADSRPERLETVKAQALAHLGHREEAVEAIQTAIQTRPEHPWTAYQAALVYALIDEPASALWNARRALAGGIEPRWFNLPWFDPIREGLAQTESDSRADSNSSTSAS